MTALPHRALTLFYCYAPEDVKFYKELDKHLTALKEPGWIQFWHNQEMLAGTSWEQEITRHLNVANIILLLISADFLASEVCAMEMKLALVKHHSGEALVIPIIIRSVDLEGTALQHLQALPQGNNVVAESLSYDDTWRQVVRDIRHAIAIMFPEVFIIMAPSDQPFAERLQQDLQPYGISIIGNNVEGTVKANEPDPALYRATAVLLLTSPNAPDSRQFRNYFTRAKLLKKRIVAIRVASEEGERAITEPLLENPLIDAHDTDYVTVLQTLVSQLRQQRQQPPITALPLPLEPRNPYKGLQAFSDTDKDDFFGRDELIREMVNTLMRIVTEKPDNHRSSRLMAVVGASGSGKSSTVMAGLLPQLQNDALPGSKQWLYVERFVPGEHPLEALALALAQISDRDALSIQSALEGDSTRILHILSSEVTQGTNAKLILFIDQFEELFTLTTSEEVQQHFIELLVSAVTDPRGPVVVLLTLRADFFDRPMAYPPFSRLIQKHLIQVLPMDLQDIRAVIEQPAALPDVQLQFEAELVNNLLLEMHGQTEALPLLQFTLEQLFQRRDGPLLTIQTYNDIGGVKGALARQIATTYAALPTEEHRKQARRLFLRLIDFTLEHKVLRRRATLTELLSGNQLHDQQINETLNAFVTDRLLSANYANGIQTYEVSHEALINEWDQLISWLNEEREGMLLLQNLRRDVAAWEKRQQPKDRLYRGQQLREARAWARQNQLNLQEAAFLRSSTIRQKQHIVSIMTFILLPILVASSILQLIATRPAWCPSFICLSPATNPLGRHDANLDIYFLGFQSSFYVISGKQAPNLNAIPDGASPSSVGAIRLGDSAQHPYRIAVQANRLYQGRYSLIIDQVTCLIKKILPLPIPLYVLSSGNSTAYTAFIYTIPYHLQDAGTSIVARTPPGSYQYLKSGESDQLDIQITSQIPANIQFQLQVTYHISTISLPKTLTLPQTFEVMFTQSTNWHEVSP